MPERADANINIWGLPNCDKPSDGRCTACCTFFGIPEDDSVGVFKTAGEKCKFADNGCLVYGFRPDRCEGGYHCSQSPNEIKLQLIEIARTEGLVTEIDARNAVDSLQNSSNN